MIFSPPKVHTRPILPIVPPRPVFVYLRPGGGTYIRPASTPSAPATYVRP